MKTYQVWVTIPKLPFNKEGLWEPWIEWLERNRSEFGPVLTWTDDGKDGLLIMIVDAESPSQAVRLAAEACDDAFATIHDRRHHPEGFKIADRRESVPA